MIDLKVVQSVLEQLEEERGIDRASIIEAIEEAFAHAYKKEYGKRGQIVTASFDMNSGATTFEQVKIVVDDSTVYEVPEDGEAPERDEDDERERFDPEKHIMIEDARLIKGSVAVGDELTFPLEAQDDFGRIAAQTAKQVMIQKIREAEKTYLSGEFGKREGEVVSGTVQRIERGNIYVDLGRAVGLLPYEEQIPGERYRQGERVRGYLYSVEETARGVFLRISRAHPDFLKRLFENESPEVANETVEVKAIAREAGSRSKIAVISHDEHVDPVGSLVGQRGVRVSTVMSELGGEKIDIIEWSEDPSEFIERALSPAHILEVEIKDDEEHQAIVHVAGDQQSLAIGRGGQNARLAAKLTGWRIDIQSVDGDESDDTTTEVVGDTTEADVSEVDAPVEEASEEVVVAETAAEETSEANPEEPKPEEEIEASEKEKDSE